MTKPVTGQYECLHRSGIGLDYFTSRVDRLTLYPNGRFALITQDRSRVVNAAQSLMSGQAITSNAPETRREGSYTRQDRLLFFSFDDGAQMQAQIAWNEEGLQIDTSFFQKISDSTVLPPTSGVLHLRPPKAFMRRFRLSRHPPRKRLNLRLFLSRLCSNSEQNLLLRRPLIPRR